MIIIVQVSEPWATPFLFIPRGSTIELNCTALHETRSPIWQIDIANDTSMLQLQFGNRGEDLNARGLFKIEEPGAPTNTVRLLINNTAVNNQTVISCDRGVDAQATTTLFVFSRSLYASKCYNMINVASSSTCVYSQFGIYRS